MFSRIRYAARVLSSSPENLSERPDVVFEEVKPEEAMRASKVIGWLIEVAILTFVVGYWLAPQLARLWPTQKFADLGRIAAVIAALFSMVLAHIIDKFKMDLWRKLKLGDRIAPFFGHKFTDAIRTLRS